MAIVGERKKRKKSGNATALPHPHTNEHWEIERDLDALGRAKAVQADPERMAKCKKMAAEKLEENKRRKEEAQAMIDLGISA